eukprot:jgi/Bigna1/85409/estExt_fgenesh1_pg.C_40019
MLKPGSRGGQEQSPSLSKCRPTVSSNRYPNGDGIGVREGGVHGRIKDTGHIAGRRSTDENEPRSVYGEDASVGAAKKDHHEEAAYLQNLCTEAMKLLNGQISQLEEEHTDYGRAVNMLLTDIKQLASELQQRTDDINDNGDAGKTFEQNVITNLQQTMTALKEAGRDHKAQEILANKHSKLVTKELRRSNAAQDERSLKKYIEIMKGIVVNNSSKQQVREGNETSTKIPPTTTPGAAGAAAATINVLKEIGKQVSDLVISHTNNDDGENNDVAAGGAGGTSGDLMNMVEKGRAQLLSLFSTKARAQKIFINRIRDTVIKFLLLKISSYPIPPIRGEMSGWKYSIYDIDLKEENLRIDPDDVAIVLTDDKTELRIRADPVHIKPTLKWNCTQLGFPYCLSNQISKRQDVKNIRKLLRRQNKRHNRLIKLLCVFLNSSPMSKRTDSGNCAAHVERASVTVTFKIHWILQHEHKKRYYQLLSRKKERKAAERRRRRKQFKPANTNIVKKKKEDKNDEDDAQDDNYSDCSNYIGAEEKRERLGEGGGKPKNLQAISKAKTTTMSQSDAIPSQHREEKEEGGDKRRRLDDATQTFDGNSNDKDKNDKKLHHSQILTADDANTTTTSMNITIITDNATQEEKKKEKKRKEKKTYVEMSDDAEEERNKGEHIERKISVTNTYISICMLIRRYGILNTTAKLVDDADRLIPTSAEQHKLQ